MLFYLANVAYLLMLCAFVTRDVLYLRGLLVVAQSIVVIYTWSTGVHVMTGWNLLFVTINAFMVVQILRERHAIILPPELRALHEKHFSALSPPEFLRWWKRGERVTIHGARLAQEGEHPAWLYFLTSGTVRISRHDRTVLELPGGYFVCEMSLLTGEPANADVDTVGTVDAVRWATRELQQWRLRDAALWTKVQSAIGHDLVEKIKLGEMRRAATAAAGGTPASA